MVVRKMMVDCFCRVTLIEESSFDRSSMIKKIIINFIIIKNYQNSQVNFFTCFRLPCDIHVHSKQLQKPK